MVTVSDVVSQLGGAEAASRALGVGTEAVRKWRQTGLIPSRHWPGIVQATGLAFADLPGASRPADPPTPDQPEMQDPAHPHTPPEGATAALVLSDGTVFWGRGFGAQTTGAVGEVCFNTGLTGYQETLTDPSYAGQIITFTFPHIGNVGTNHDDMEAAGIAARGVVIKQDLGAPSNWRSLQPLDGWLKARAIPGISGVDTRALTHRIRDGRPPHGVLAYPADGSFDIAALTAQAAAWPGLDGMDLAREVSCTQCYEWDEMEWAWPAGFARQTAPRHHVVAVDYGAKRNILRCLAASGCRVTVVPAQSPAEDILRHHPDGVFLSNGPGDPAATAAYAVPAIQAVMAAGVPIFGICLGHQLLAHALGGTTRKMKMGHRGANQPVKDLVSGRVEITSQNHGFEVDTDSLPDGVRVTHTSLFDGSNEGIACAGRRCFSVQYHPEASPGPSDSHYLFERFIRILDD
jgi:carbamoyl-phosphate synthase small subunit